MKNDTYQSLAEAFKNKLVEVSASSLLKEYLGHSSVETAKTIASVPEGGALLVHDAKYLLSAWETASQEVVFSLLKGANENLTVVFNATASVAKELTASYDEVETKCRFINDPVAANNHWGKSL